MHTFGAGILIRLSFWLTLLSAPFVCWLAHDSPDATYVYEVFLLGFVLWFLSWPRSIYFDSEGIRQRDLIGRERFIPWQAVEVVRHSSGGRTIVGVEQGNKEIVHTQLHANRDLFCQLIEKRTGVQDLYEPGSDSY